MSSMCEVVGTDQEMDQFDWLRDSGTVETDVSVSGTPSESMLQVMREIWLWVS